MGLWPRMRLTGGNLINCPCKLTTRRADITTTKIILNSVVSTEGVRYRCLNVCDFYRETLMDTFEYMKMLLALFLEWTRKQYNLDEHAINGFVFWIRSAI